MVKETEKLKKFNKELEEIKEKVRVHNSRLNLLEEKSQQRPQTELTTLKKPLLEDDLIQRYQEETELPIQKQDVQNQVTETEEILIYEINEKPPDSLTLEQVYKYCQDNNYYHLCKSKQKFPIFAKLVSIAKSTINPTTNKTIPAKIVIEDQSGRRFRNVVWSKTMESQLTQLLQCWIVFSEVYLKQVKEQYLSKNFHIFETLNKLENRLERKQFEFQVNKCKIFRVKSKRAEEQ